MKNSSGFMNDPIVSDSAQRLTPLNRIKVLDFSHILAGPFCTRLLADLGADVVRVETVARPDHLAERKLDSQSKAHPDRPPSYQNLNRNKRSIAVNLKMEAGRQLVTRLASVTDVVVENFSAGVMARLQLDYQHLQPLNPLLVYASMSGYGHNGPRRNWTSMNMNLQAYTGLMMTTGAENDPPTAISNSWNDYIGGFHACVGILQALTKRGKTGAGAYLDLSQFECSVASLGPLLLHSAVNRRAPQRLGSRSTQVAPQGVYRCAGIDEWCAISIQDDDQWRSLIGVMGSPPWATASRFETALGRLEAHDEIDAQIELWTAPLENTQVENLLKDVGVPAERMRRIKDVLDSSDRGRIFRPMEDPKRGPVMATGAPFTFGGSCLSSLKPAPSLGEHTREILSDWLSIGDSEFAEIEKQEVLV
jgi:benzylsuccinate CoA-transferase BbsF subunit